MFEVGFIGVVSCGLPTTPLSSPLGTSAADVMSVGDEGVGSGSDDDLEVIFDDEQFLRQQSTAHVTPPSLVDTSPSPRLDVLGGENFDVDSPLGEQLVTLLTEDKEIDLPQKTVKQLLRVLVNNPILIPRMSNEPLGNSDLMFRSVETSDLLLEDLIMRLA
ncbi:hypothetical protein Tco_0149028 [Tanacetum coccineum]